MVDPVKGKKYLEQVKAIRSKYKPKKAKPISQSTFTSKNDQKSNPAKPNREVSDNKKPWWKLW
jgi:hypothetical protein